MEQLIKPQEVVNGGYLRAAPTSVRFDSTQLSPMIIQVAMLKHVIPTICETLYNNLIAARTTGIANYNAALGTVYPMFPSNATYEALWVEGGLESMVATAVIHTWLPYGTIQNRSTGQQQINTQYSQNADIKGIQFMSDTLQNDLNVLKAAVKKYLGISNNNTTCNGNGYANCSGHMTTSDDVAPYNFIIY